MKIRPLSKRSVFVIGIAVTVCSITVVVLQNSSSIVFASQIIALRTGALGANLPNRLLIPKIGVEAAVEYVGLTPEGAMATPGGRTNVGWFDKGPRPGEKGSAVMAGHEGWKNDLPAVFDNLINLKKGDEILVQDKSGITTVFVVRQIKTFNETGDTTSIFTSTDGKSHLNLITCEGIWNAATKSYSNRLVVFADLK